MAWELLTKVWKLDPTRLHVSCYEGDEKHGVPRDTEAADIWKEIAGASARIRPHPLLRQGQFLGNGRHRPLRPLHRDLHRPHARTKPAAPAPVNGNDPRVMEIWNLVFIQYNRDAAGKLTTLPAQHVDTGMGLERICQVLQDKDDNYGTDLFTPLFDAIAEISRASNTPANSPRPTPPIRSRGRRSPQLRHDIAFRVIADHVRCLTFALTDGAVPSNEGRGYVLRRILRRAVRFGRQQLDLHEPFMHKLVPVVVESMGEMFPELKKNPQRVIDYKDEEVSFGKTLDRGINLFDEAASPQLLKSLFVSNRTPRSPQC